MYSVDSSSSKVFDVVDCFGRVSGSSSDYSILLDELSHEVLVRF